MKPGSSSSGVSQPLREKSPSTEILDSFQSQKNPSHGGGAKQQPSQPQFQEQAQQQRQQTPLSSLIPSISTMSTSKHNMGQSQSERRRCLKCHILLAQTNWYDMCAGCRESDSKDNRDKKNGLKEGPQSAKYSTKTAPMGQSAATAKGTEPSSSGSKAVNRPDVGGSSEMSAHRGNVGLCAAPSQGVSSSKSQSVQAAPKSIKTSKPMQPPSTSLTGARASSVISSSTSTTTNSISEGKQLHEPQISQWLQKQEHSSKSAASRPGKRSIGNSSAYSHSSDSDDISERPQKTPKIDTQTLSTNILETMGQSLGSSAPQEADKGKSKAIAQLFLPEDDINSPIDLPLTHQQLVEAHQREFAAMAKRPNVGGDEKDQYQTSAHLLNKLKLERKAKKDKLNFYGTFSIIVGLGTTNAMSSKAVSRDLRAVAKLKFKMTPTAIYSLGLPNRGVGKGYRCTCLDHLLPKSQQLGNTNTTNEPETSSAADTAAQSCYNVCGGKILVVVEDDMSHPLLIPGQKTSVWVKH